MRQTLELIVWRSLSSSDPSERSPEILENETLVMPILNGGFELEK